MWVNQSVTYVGGLDQVISADQQLCVLCGKHKSNLCFDDVINLRVMLIAQANNPFLDEAFIDRSYYSEYLASFGPCVEAWGRMKSNFSPMSKEQNKAITLKLSTNAKELAKRPQFIWITSRLSKADIQDPSKYKKIFDEIDRTLRTYSNYEKERNDLRVLPLLKTNSPHFYSRAFEEHLKAQNLPDTAAAVELRILINKQN